MNTNALHWYAVFKILSNPLLFISRFAMSQKFYPVSGRNWFTLDTVQLQSNGSTANFLGRRGIYAPAEYSFHCQTVNSFRDALLVPNSTAGNTTEWRLNFIDFQVQVLHLHPVTQYPCSNASSPFIMENVFFFFLVIRCLLSLYVHRVFSAFDFTLQIQGFGLSNGTNFSYASDCAGFFTPGIWMGLLTSLLMLYIFVYGLHMIMQLNTMDRFDDPKGPSISVPQSEWRSHTHKTHTLLSTSVPPYKSWTQESILVLSLLCSWAFFFEYVC